MLLSAICGDVIGSVYEGASQHTKCLDFSVFNKGSQFTDDTVVMCATAYWLISGEHTPERLVSIMKEYCQMYPEVGYGRTFREWVFSDDEEPYGSYGNGSAIRGIPIAMYADSMEEAMELSEIAASITHNSPEGIIGTQAVAATAYLLRKGKTEGYIRNYIKAHFFYDIFTAEEYDKVQEEYEFDVSCEGSVPEAISCALNYSDGAEAIRHAVALGGDSDTQAAIAGGIRGLNSEEGKEWRDNVYKNYLDSELRDIVDAFNEYVGIQ